MKKICCDLCGKVLTKKEGIRTLEISKISDTSFDNYPQSYDSNFLIGRDIYLKCFLKIKKEINKISK